jgi:hypothetical protein
MHSSGGAMHFKLVPKLIPNRVDQRDFQARWKSPALGLFLGAASSTDPFTHHFRLRAKPFDTKLSRDLSLTR